MEVKMKKSNYDFSGWATKNDVRCADGRIIRKDAFAECDGVTVPLVYNHDHSNIRAVIGHADLENREDGVYAYGYLNSTEKGKEAKIMLEHGDITNLSIYANHLQHSGSEVIHGMIREVSLVLAGANPGAKIEYVMSHGDFLDDDFTEADIYTDEALVLRHSDDEDEEDEKKKKESEESEEESEEETKEEESEEDKEDEKEIKHSDDSKSEENKEDSKMASPKEVFEAMTEEQQEAVYAIVGAAVEEATKGNQEDENMKHSVFAGEEAGYYEDELSHADMEAVFSDMKRYGTLKESCLQHGIENIDVLFPDAKAISNEPSLIKRDTTWVDRVLGATHHTPFSLVKSVHANITADEARAKGYIKGHLKKEEVITALKRKTGPQTIYKKQAMDRDDILDITDFNVVAYLKAEMRIMLNEELARAILIGDGRDVLDDDKIKEDNIRPIWKDSEVYTITKTITDKGSAQKNAEAFIETAIRARKDYKGSGSPVLFTTEDRLTDMLLMKDGIDRDLYESVDKLKTKLRVSDIITVPVAEGATFTKDGVVNTFGGIIVNLSDYNVGADQGGSVTMFDDFDIDYNKEKYLIETRCSGALTVPYSAIAINFVPAAGSNNAPAEENSEVTEG